MLYKKVSIFLFIILSLIPIQNIFAQTQNVGIIPSNIWYSKDPFEEGDNIKIYTVVYNSDSRQLSGSAIFFDNNVLLGKEDFSVAPKSIVDISINWTVTAGDHNIFAKIENAKFLISKGKYEEVYLADNKTEESKKKISKKIVADIPNSIVDKISESAGSMPDVGQILKDNTPSVVSKTIDSTIGALETAREAGNNFVTENKNTIQKQIDAMNVTSNSIANTSSKNNAKNADISQGQVKSIESPNKILKPFKYVELFFLSILTFIFNNKIIFYLLLLALLLFVLRYIWYLIF